MAADAERMGSMPRLYLETLDDNTIGIFYEIGAMNRLVCTGKIEDKNIFEEMVAAYNNVQRKIRHGF